MSNSALANSLLATRMGQPALQEIPVLLCADCFLAGSIPSFNPASNSRIRLINAYPLQGHPLPQTDIPGFSPQPTIQCT